MTKVQTDTGKALEYCFAVVYYEDLSALGLNAFLIENNNYFKAQRSFNSFSPDEQKSYYVAAKSTINTMVKLEPGLTNQRDIFDPLEISIASDSAGQAGDVRDVIFRRKGWEIGFSLKNNHDAAKHSRLSRSIDFGREWLGHPCSANYFNEVSLVFNSIKKAVLLNREAKWSDYPNKDGDIYVPILNAFQNEMLSLNKLYADVPGKLLSYLIGRNSFYKIIKRDQQSLVVVKGYNMNKDLGKTYNKVAGVCSIPTVSYPTRIIEFVRNAGNTTLIMTLDNGWQISFRIHSASTRLEESLKFDINLTGNPPSLFTHYIF